MSRRTLIAVVASIGAIVLANIVILAIWLPHRTNPPTNVERGSTAGTTQLPASGTGHAHSPPPVAAGFVVERQIPSASGNLRVKYARDRKTKVRRIIVEDAHRPDASMVLYESKNNAWVLVSPDDQWIALDERTGPDGGGARLYHRANVSSLRYEPVGDPGKAGLELQDAVWKVYLGATNGNAATSRRGVTIDATGWEKDSRKVNIAVAHLPSPGKPDVPEPWSCTYDVASKQVEPIPDQPVAEPETAEGATGNQGSNEPAFANVGEMGSDQPAGGDDDEEADDALPGERFPATREDELADADVSESSLEDISYAINEMYARHGAEFKDRRVAQQFSEFPWYEPRPGVATAEIEKEFSDVEKKNLVILNRCRDAKLGSGQGKSRSGRNAPGHNSAIHPAGLVSYLTIQRPKI